MPVWKRTLAWLAGRVFSARTVSLIRYDLQRLPPRLKRFREKNVLPAQSKLHLGCGGRHVRGWLNVDLAASDYDLDLASGRLPWRSGVFEAIVGQHVIEHLELKTELLPLLRESRRILTPGSEIWLSCPDIEKICRSYLEHDMRDLLEDRLIRWPSYSLENMPSSQMINDLFHQNGQHKNLFDFRLLEWALRECGFASVSRVSEADLLGRFPEFLPRGDDLQSIYVRAIATESESTKP